MKKRLVVLVVTLVVALSMNAVCFPSYAAAAVVPENEMVAPFSTLSITFSNLGPGTGVTSTAVYSIVDSDALLSVLSCTWAPVTQDIIIGYYNVDTGVIYGIRFEKGSANPIGINSAGVPDGEYRIVVQNVGTKMVSGVLNYRVS